jgi:hypothetical protein
VARESRLRLQQLTTATGSFGLMQMFFGIGTVGMSFWLPTIVSGFGLTGTSVSAVIMTRLPVT